MRKNETFIKLAKDDTFSINGGDMSIIQKDTLEHIENITSGFLPDAEENTIAGIPEVVHDVNRRLKISVWGRSRRKTVPNLDHNFNACVLYGKKNGLDTRHDARKDDDIMRSVIRCPLFFDFMTVMVTLIEKRGLSNIGINCSKGRHRSVSCARVLKEHFYPNAEILYLELK